MTTAKKTLMSLIKASVGELTPEESFLVELKQTVAKCNPPEKGSNYYKPSSMNCDRCMYYMATDAEPDEELPTYNSVRITECGSSSHERIQYYVSQMRNKGYDCDWIDPEWYAKVKNLDYLVVRDKKEFETKFLDTRYNLSFLCDGIIRYRGKYYILEIKTEVDFKNKNRTSADPKHRNQSICYALSLKINDIMWLYENRNICEAKTFHTNVTEEEKESVVMRIEYVDNCKRNGKVPGKTDLLETCKYCQFKNRCRKQV